MKRRAAQRQRRAREATVAAELAVLAEEKAKLAALPPSVILCGGKLYSYDTAGALVAVDGEAVVPTEKAAPGELTPTVVKLTTRFTTTPYVTWSDEPVK